MRKLVRLVEILAMEVDRKSGRVVISTEEGKHTYRLRQCVVEIRDGCLAARMGREMVWKRKKFGVWREMQITLIFHDSDQAMRYKIFQDSSSVQDQSHEAE